MASVRVCQAIDVLSEMGPQDLDDCSVEELCMLQFYMQKVGASLFMKTVGRLAAEMEDMKADLRSRPV